MWHCTFIKLGASKETNKTRVRVRHGSIAFIYFFTFLLILMHPSPPRSPSKVVNVAPTAVC